eukprot:2845717-Pleurochrysis_carterae.AAC.1
MISPAQRVSPCPIVADRAGRPFDRELILQSGSNPVRLKTSHRKLLPSQYATCLQVPPFSQILLVYAAAI